MRINNTDLRSFNLNLSSKFSTTLFFFMWSPKYQLSFYSKLYPESFIYLLIQFLNLQLDIRQLVIHFNSFIFVNSFLVLLFIIVSRNCFPICMSTGPHVSSTSCSVLKPTAINTRINNTQSHRWL